MTRQHTPAQAAESAGTPARPGVARADLATPPEERGVAPEGAVSRVSPTPTRGRVIIPLSEPGSVVTDALPRRHGWRVEHINNAPDAEAALRRMFEWARAELARCQQNRPADADGFRWQLIHLMTPVVAAVHKGHPLPEFRSLPKLPGGGWSPRKPKTRAGEARQP